MFYDKKYKDYDQLIESINRYINYYNTGRFQARLKDMSPMEYRSHALE